MPKTRFKCEHNVVDNRDGEESDEEIEMDVNSQYSTLDDLLLEYAEDDQGEVCWYFTDNISFSLPSK